MKFIFRALPVATLFTFAHLYPVTIAAQITPETVKAFETHKARALKGEPIEQAVLAGCYQVGKGVEVDLEEAALWYRKSAEQGYAGAQYALGDCYAGGRGVAKDSAEALIWYRKAAKQGDPFHQQAFAFKLETGPEVGLTKDLVEAVKWYRKAADQGDDLSLGAMGGFYRDGITVAKDEVEAYAYSVLYGKEAKQTLDLEKTMTAEAKSKGLKRSKELQDLIDARKAGKDAAR